MLRSPCTLCACLALLACEQSRADVLEEFPPPRLAREKSLATLTSESVETDCNATWRLFGRKSRETYHLVGRGTFEVRGQPARPVSGIVAFDPSEAKPDLRAAVERSLQSRGEKAPWVWRVLSVEQPALGFESANPASATALTGLSEMEFNGVRTRQNHALSVRLTSKEEQLGEIAFDTQLRLDFPAHRVVGLTLLDESPLRRADLVVECKLTAAEDGE